MTDRMLSANACRERLLSTLELTPEEKARVTTELKLLHLRVDAALRKNDYKLADIQPFLGALPSRVREAVCLELQLLGFQLRRSGERGEELELRWFTSY